MTLLCKSRKRRRRRAIGAALTLRESFLSASSTRRASDFENVEGRPDRARNVDARGYYLARKFLLRTQDFFFTRVITSLPRKAVPATSRSDPYFSFFFFNLSRSLSRLSPSLALLPLLSALFFSFCGTDLHTETRTYQAYSWETWGSSFWCPFPAPFVKGQPFVHGFSWKIELNDSQSNISRYYSSAGLWCL